MFVAGQAFNAPFVTSCQFLVNRPSLLAIGGFGPTSLDLLPKE